MKQHHYLTLSALLLGHLSPSAMGALNCDRSFGLQAENITQSTLGNTICSSSSLEFRDSVQDFRLSLGSNYTETDQVNVFGRISDVNVDLSYAGNSTELVYSFPQLGVSGSFDEGSRDASQDAFEEWVKRGNILSQIMKYQSDNSPTSPITGVGGLIPMSAAADFNSNFTDTATNIAGPTRATSGDNISNLIGASLSYGSWNLDKNGDKVSTVSLPLSYTYRSSENPKKQIVFSLPLTQTSVDEAKVYQASFGVSMRLPILENWTLTPGLKYGVVASEDRAAVASVYSGSLTSTYLMPLGDYSLGIGNMISYYETGEFDIDDYSANPGINQTLTRNGLMLSQPVHLFGHNLAIEYSLIDTRYLSNAPYISDMQEIGITLGTDKNVVDSDSYIRGGLTFMRAKDSNGVMANVGYWF